MTTLYVNMTLVLFFSQGLCGEEILHDISLVLEHFRDELTKIDQEFEILQMNLILEPDHPLKKLLHRTINDIRNTVIYLRGTDVTMNNFHTWEAEIPTSGEMFRKYLHIVSDLGNFITSSLSIIDLK